MTEQIISELLKSKTPDKKYEEPFLILLCENCGSGKSLISKILSNKLSCYIVSKDHIRNILLSIDKNADTLKDSYRKIIDKVLCYEIDRCLDNNYSVVVDSSVSNYNNLEYFKKFNCKKILIKIESQDDMNIKRCIERKNENHTKEKFLYYGHQDSTSGIITEEDYYLVKNRKIYNLDDNIFNYKIINDGDINNLENQVVNITNKITLQNKKN